ncbi:hypothetical protein V1478_012768 [Vespula squamosa]|uniref:Uncharacterized protein n=1 Tax=Vespula squamosa TaxID=30214 RepID=A0ABD2A8W4_VESSQ
MAPLVSHESVTKSANVAANDSLVALSRSHVNVDGDDDDDDNDDDDDVRCQAVGTTEERYLGESYDSFARDFIYSLLTLANMHGAVSCDMIGTCNAVRTAGSS